METESKLINFVVEDGSGVPNANSYVSLEEADDIASLNLHTANAWAALTSPQKQSLLIYVTGALDARTQWGGSRSSPHQGLEWPRQGVQDRYGNALSASAVPYNLRWAVVELAKYNIDADRLSVERTDSVVSELQVGPIKLSFADAAGVASQQFKAPEIVTDLLLGLGTIRSSSRKVTFGRILRA
jgi:hypothetical protein